jgi:4-amino-4-deoxychorismate mutase
MSTPPPEPLQDLREELDRLDYELLALLGRRFDVCREVAGRKAQLAIPMMQPGRVRVVEERAMAEARRCGYSEEFALELYRLIVAEACRIEDELMASSR